MRRYNIYKKYIDFYQDKKDIRSMDEICKNETDFNLQLQQKFLKDFTKDNKEWDKLLLYHQIGSGKTCTAITIAEEYLKNNPDKSVIVILPARLKTNFIDELISPCGVEKYLSKIDFINYQDNETSDRDKTLIKNKFIKNIEKVYNIISYNSFSLSIKKFTNITDWVNNFTKDKLIIIDEVHNLISSSYNKIQYNKIKKLNKFDKKIKNKSTILLKLLTEYADPSCKMIFLTGTPVFDNIKQFYELVNIMNNGKIDTKKLTKFEDFVNLLRGKISYFPGISYNSYPATEYYIQDCIMSKEQEKEIIELTEENKLKDYEDISDSFMIKQRQISICCRNADKTDIILNTKTYSPKLYNLMNNIKNSSSHGKHLIYSSFLEKGLYILKELLDKNGYINIFNVLDNNTKWKEYEYKVYVIWDSTLNDVNKMKIKSLLNCKENIDGKLIKIIMGSPSIKEGISFKHIQQMHMLDPVWNNSSKNQIEGRAIRFCSHIDIPLTDPKLKRKVKIIIYKLIPYVGSSIIETSDMVIYDKIIPYKFNLTNKAEKSLKKIAIDHYLFRRLYMSSDKIISPSYSDKSKSPLNLSEIKDIVIKKKSIKNTCLPAKRRPKDNKCIEDNYEVRKNKHGDDCCYKKKMIK